MHASHRARFPNDLTSQVTREGRDPVASGGFADIYRGMFQQNGESIRVAIKSIKTYSGEDRSFSKKQKRLRREIKVWLGLRHDNVLPLLGTTMGFGQFPAMVCPWVENGSLTSYLTDRHHTLPVAKILGLLNNVACGLSHLHSSSIVHGDLSGSNVLIREDGIACIADFGLSMLLTELGGSTFATSFHAKGTLRWTAPELLDLDVPEDDLDEESQRVMPTTQSDVYSFGSIMLQILSGKVPYHYYKREGQVVHAISKGKKPKRPSNTLVTDARWMFIEQCWSAIDARRPSSNRVVEFTEKELADNLPRMPTTRKDNIDSRPRRSVEVKSTSAHGHLPLHEIKARVPELEVLRHWQQEVVVPTEIDNAVSALPPFIPPPIPIQAVTASNHVRRRSPPGYPPQRFRPRHDSNDSIPDITVEPPSEPESPELSSEDTLSILKIRPVPLHGTGIVYDSALRASSLHRPSDQDSTSNTKSGDHRRAHSVHFSENPKPVLGQPRNGYVRTREQISEDLMAELRFPYAASPVPLGVSYPAPPVRRPYKNQNRGGDVRREGDAAHLLDALVEFLPGTFAFAKPALW